MLDVNLEFIGEQKRRLANGQRTAPSGFQAYATAPGKGQANHVEVKDGKIAIVPHV